MTARAQTLVTLTITPAMGPYGDRTRVRLVRSSAGFHAVSAVYSATDKRVSRADIPESVAEAWLARLRKARVPAIPVSDVVLDGEFVELSIAGTCADLKLSYWTVAPAGCEDIAEFVDWLRSFADEGQLP